MNYEVVSHQGLYVVRDTKKKRWYSNPVKQGLAMDIARVFNSNAVCNPAPITMDGDVVIKLMGNDDQFRIIQERHLRELAGRTITNKREQDLMKLSVPCPIDSESMVDFVIEAEDQISWNDIHTQLIEQEIQPDTREGKRGK